MGHGKRLLIGLTLYWFDSQGLPYLLDVFQLVVLLVVRPAGLWQVALVNCQS